MRSYRNLILAVIVFTAFPAVFFGWGKVFAQGAVSDRRAELERELANLEEDIEKQSAVLAEKQRQSVSLERDVQILDAKIEKARLSIKARDLAIRKLTEDIAGKNKVIGSLSEKIEREKESLADLLKRTDRIDSYTMPEVIFASKSLSEFFGDVDSYNSIKKALQESAEKIKGDKEETEAEKAGLEEKKSEETELRSIQLLEKKRIEEQTAEKKNILKVSRGIESVYKQIVESRKKDAAKIRAELFTLRGSAAIPFEKAYEYALAASNKTGVRPAVILGIIAEESNLGENLGSGNWKVDMKDPRDTVPFKDITSRLGLDPDKMPVSKKPWYGWGGAMGPAQFIPSTWILYEKRVASMTGHNPPNPWDPYDAFIASAILMKDNGADKRTRAAERLAALRYLAGWTNATKKAYAFYGDDVMDLADKYQALIDVLQSN